MERSSYNRVGYEEMSSWAYRHCPGSLDGGLGAAIDRLGLGWPAHEAQNRRAIDQDARAALLAARPHHLQAETRQALSVALERSGYVFSFLVLVIRSSLL